MKFCVASLLLSVVVGLGASADPVDVGTRKQLFIDHRFIEKQEGITLQANPAEKLGLLLDPEGKRFNGHISRVIQDGDKARMYLGADRVQVLESDDALHYRDTGNTVGGGIFTTLFLDEHEADPARRYKAFWIDYSPPFDPAVHGVYAGYSADGLNFTKVGRVLPFYTDNPCLVNWDERIGKYVIYTRALAYDSPNQRRVARIEVDDLHQPWPYTPSDQEGMFFSTSHANVVIAADDKDDPNSDLYYNGAVLYPWAQDAYLMFTTQFRHFDVNRQPFIKMREGGGWEDFGLLEVQLATSRDGIAWDRPSREPYFPMGLADEWDRWYTVMGPGMVKRGNYIYQYYNSSSRTHDGASVRAEYENSVPQDQLGGIGVLRQRLDGFVSADADYKGGWLETPVLKFSGRRLRLNIDTGAMGTAFVELRDAEGKPIEGFTIADCEEIGGNYIDQRVYWKGNTDVSALAGKPVRLYVKLTRGKLYAFQFTEE